MSSLAWTYNTLYQALQDWPVHADPRYLSNLPKIISLAERRLWGDLNIEEYDKTDNTTVQSIIGNPRMNKPSDVIQLRSVGVLVAGKFKALELRSIDYCMNFGNGGEGQPLYYAEETDTDIYLSPPPDAAYQAVYRYIGILSQTLDPTTPGQTTWLSRVAPDALFAAALAEAEQYIKADDRYQDYITKYNNELLPRVRAELRKSIRRGQDPLLPGTGVAQ